MKYLDELTKPFLGADELRPAMMNSILDNGLIVTTNAHVLIAAPQRYYKEEYSFNAKYPDWRSVVPSHTPDNQLFSIDVIALSAMLSILPTEPDYADCPECKGFGYSDDMEEDECKVCKGDCVDLNNIIGHEIRWYNDELGYSLKLQEARFNPNFFKAICDMAIHLDIKKLTCVVLEPKSMCVFYLNDIMLIVMPIDYSELAINNTTIEMPIKK